MLDFLGLFKSRSAEQSRKPLCALRTLAWPLVVGGLSLSQVAGANQRCISALNFQNAHPLKASTPLKPQSPLSKETGVDSSRSVRPMVEAEASSAPWSLIVDELVELTLRGHNDDVNFWRSITVKSLLQDKRRELEAQLGTAETEKVFAEMQRRLIARLHKTQSLISGREKSGREPLPESEMRKTKNPQTTIFKPALLSTFKQDHFKPQEVAFMPNSQLIAAVGFGKTNTIVVWDLRSGQPVQLWGGGNTENRSISLSSDNKYLSIHSWQTSTTSFLDPQSGELRAQFRGHNIAHHSPLFSPDGQFILMATNDGYRAGVAKLVDLRNNGEVKLLEGHSGAIRALAFSRDGTKVVTASEDRTAKVWDAKTGALIRTFPEHNYWVSAVAFSSDNKILATHDWSDKTVRIWDASSGKKLLDLPPFASYVDSLSFSPDNQWLLIQTENSAKLWNLATGTEAYDLSGKKFVTSSAFSPNGEYILIAQHLTGVAVLKEVTTGKTLKEFPKGKQSNLARFSPDGKYLILGQDDGSVDVWSLYDKVSIDDNFVNGP